MPDKFGQAVGYIVAHSRQAAVYLPRPSTAVQFTEFFLISKADFVAD